VYTLRRQFGVDNKKHQGDGSKPIDNNDQKIINDAVNDAVAWLDNNKDATIKDLQWQKMELEHTVLMITRKSMSNNTTKDEL
jgi:hypothetical protein